MRRLWRFAVAVGVALFALSAAGCGDDGFHAVGPPPGLVGIVDHPSDPISAPRLSLEYTLPGSALLFAAQILSDQRSDGDIVFDPLSASYAITHGPHVLLFGIDGRGANAPEYRAFLDFPLDGSAGGPVIPVEAHIVSATLSVTIDFVDFAHRVPVLLELVRYSVITGLTPADFDSFPLAGRAFEIFDFHEGREVRIDVTHLMREAQRRALDDFQLRFMVGG